MGPLRAMGPWAVFIGRVPCGCGANPRYTGREPRCKPTKAGTPAGGYTLERLAGQYFPPIPIGMSSPDGPPDARGPLEVLVGLSWENSILLLPELITLVLYSYMLLFKHACVFFSEIPPFEELQDPNSSPRREEVGRRTLGDYGGLLLPFFYRDRFHLFTRQI